MRSSFDRDFNTIRGITIFMVIFTIVTAIAVIVGGFILFGWAISNPEGIGEFFGKVFSGFKGAM